MKARRVFILLPLPCPTLKGFAVDTEAGRARARKAKSWSVCLAGHVTACELFPPMAAAAKRAVHANGCSDTVKVVAKRSSDLVMGETHAHRRMTKRPNVDPPCETPSTYLGSSIANSKQDNTL